MEHRRSPSPTSSRRRVPLASLVATAVLAVSACGDDGDEGRIRGSGDTTIVSRDLAAFDRIVLAGEGRVAFSEGTDGRVEIETDDNLVELLVTTVADGTLTISTRPGVDVEPSAGITYRLGCPEVEAVTLTGAGDIDLAGCANPDRLAIELTGAGDITAPDLDLSSLRITLPGAGSVDASGVADELEVAIAGAGALDAADLEVEVATISATGVGSATVWVTDQLDVSLTGVGSVGYHGDPDVTTSVAGVGTVDALGPK